MTTEPSVYEELPAEECRRLLGAQHLGRIAVVLDGQPVIFPVNYAVDGDTVVFRTDPGTKLDAAPLGRVAFEIDGFDEAERTGWSVIVQGFGEDFTDSIDDSSEFLRTIGVDPWLPGQRTHWVRIIARSVTGRRLRHQSS